MMNSSDNSASKASFGSTSSDSSSLSSAIPVEVWVYDLSGGLAKVFSMALLGKQIDAIYHTSIVAYGYEFYFGQGINTASPGMTAFGQPKQKILLGLTHIPFPIFTEFLSSLSSTQFTSTSYHLFDNNCNHFSSTVATFLTGKDIPDNIKRLPQEVLETDFGRNMVKPVVEGMMKRGEAVRGEMIGSLSATAINGHLQRVNEMNEIKEESSKIAAIDSLPAPILQDDNDLVINDVQLREIRDLQPTSFMESKDRFISFFSSSLPSNKFIAKEFMLILSNFLYRCCLYSAHLEPSFSSLLIEYIRSMPSKEDSNSELAILCLNLSLLLENEADLAIDLAAYIAESIKNEPSGDIQLTKMNTLKVLSKIDDVNDLLAAMDIQLK